MAHKEWVNLVSARGEVESEGASFLDGFSKQTVALVTLGACFPAANESIGEYRRALLGDDVPGRRQGLRIRREPLYTTSEATLLVAEASFDDEPKIGLALTAVLSSVLCVVTDTEEKVAAWNIFADGLEAVMQTVKLNGHGGPEDHEAVFEALPRLVWAFGSGSESATKRLEKVLNDESSFSEETTRRNHTRLLIKSIFRQRTAVSAPNALGLKARDLAAPKLCYGRLATGRGLVILAKAWTASLLGTASEKMSLSLVDGWTAVVDDSNRRAMDAAKKVFSRKAAGLRDEDDDETTPSAQLKLNAKKQTPDLLDESVSSLEERLASAVSKAENLFTELTRSVAPVPRNAEKAPVVPLEELRAWLRNESNARLIRHAEQARQTCAIDAAKRHAALVKAADSATGISRSPEGGVQVPHPGSNDDEDDDIPASRRAESWIQAYQSRISTVISEHYEALKCSDAARDVMGQTLGESMPSALSLRGKACLDALIKERSVAVDAMATKQRATLEITQKLAEARDDAAQQMRQHHEKLAASMTETETAKMERESQLATLDEQILAAGRNAERVDARLRIRLEACVSRASARLGDAKLYGQRQEEAAQALALEAAEAKHLLTDARLDALRVRCVTLGHEKANLAEHMELLEEHLERLKHDLDQKQAEVAEVEHQWAQTKAKLPGLKSKHAQSERRRADLADLARKFKLKVKELGKSGALPRQLLQHLDPMERQALDDL